ncbi:MAG: OmpA family protein [Bryobacterales bacterium]|nr:OmpA family protein [Acidobacteriota bacterium]MCB9384924.1 OmpA family protein [Bryobacterales bacterium]
MPAWAPWIGFMTALGLLIFQCISSKAPSIESDLSTKTVAALAAQNVNLGSDFVMDGRDAWLTGTVATPELKAAAGRAAAGVSGVRVVHNLLHVDANATAPAAPVPAEATPTSPAPSPAPAAKQELQRSINDLIAGRVVEFESGSDRLTQRGGALVDELGSLLSRFPDARIEIAGHTDSQGTSRNNLTLSKRRAEAVRKRLVAGGVAENRLRAEGYGEDRPIADNKTSQGRLRNRRVELTVQ